MEKKSIWLILFAVVAIAAGYMWWSGGSTPKTEEPTEPVADSSLSDPDAPALGTGKEQIRPTVPGARQEAGSMVPDAQSPNMRTAPAPGFTSPPPSYESFNAPNPPPSEAPAPGRGDPPPSAFEPVPPQAFENPDFATPPPPPPQFDTEPPPFDSEQVPQQNYDVPPDGSGEFVPPAEPEGY